MDYARTLLLANKQITVVIQHLHKEHVHHKFSRNSNTYIAVLYTNTIYFIIAQKISVSVEADDRKY